MVTKVIEESFELNSDVAGMTERDLAAKTADGSLQPVFEYEVPVGYSLVFTGEDTLSAYIEDDGVPAEAVGSTTRVDIVIMDASKHNVRSVMNPTFYTNIKEFQDIDKLKHMDITPGDQVIAREGERVCLRVDEITSGIATIDASECYWRLTCKRIRHSLFA